MALLELKGVEKHFGGLPAVDGVSLRADDGEIVAVVGPNGAGKSTLLKLVVGLERPDGGSIVLDGGDMTGEPAHRVRRMGVAMVQQTPRAFPNLTVLENVTLGAMFGRPGGHRDEAAAVETAGEMLSFVGLGHRSNDHVDSLNLHQQRLLELARALSSGPRLLLLDEVMAGLNDAELEASVDIVREIRARHGVTVIWVEHVMKAVMRLAERVIVLNFGQVLIEGPPAEVMRDPAVIEAYLGEEIRDA